MSDLFYVKFKTYFLVRIKRHWAARSPLFRKILARLREVGIAKISVILTLVGFELIIKQVLESRLITWGGAASVFPGVQLSLSHNRGVSFGLFESDHWLMPYGLAGIALVLVVAAVVWTARQKSKLVNLAGTLLAVGGLANAIDRLGDGAVTDYLEIGWQAIRWPTFNLADVFIFIAVALLLVGWRKGVQDLDGHPQ